MICYWNYWRWWRCEFWSKWVSWDWSRIGGGPWEPAALITPFPSLSWNPHGPRLVEKICPTWTNSADELVWYGTGFTVTVRPVSLHQRLMGWKHRREISLNVRFMFPKSCNVLNSMTTNQIQPQVTCLYRSQSKAIIILPNSVYVLFDALYK